MKPNSAKEEKRQKIRKALETAIDKKDFKSERKRSKTLCVDALFSNQLKKRGHYTIAITDRYARYRNEVRLALETALKRRNFTYEINEYDSNTTMLQDIISKNTVYDLAIIEITAKQGFTHIDELRKIDKNIKIFAFIQELQLIRGDIHGVSGFLLKGSQMERELEEAVEALSSEFNRDNVKEVVFKTRLVKKGDIEHKPVDRDSILRVYRENGIVYLQTYSYTIPILKKTLIELKELLGEDFFIIKRNHLVNFKNVTQIKGDYLIFKSFYFNSEGRETPFTLPLSVTPKTKRKVKEAFEKYKQEVMQKDT